MPSVKSVPIFQGLPLSVDRLLNLYPGTLTKTTEKDKSRTRVLVKCNICSEFEDAARKATVNNQVPPYASCKGARTEGQDGAKRLIEHLKSNAHHAALQEQQL